MQKLEYKMVSLQIFQGYDKPLTDRGNEGWELVQVMENRFGEHVGIFKRPLIE